MPVIISRRPRALPAAPPRLRRGRLAEAARALAPIIAEIREAGHNSIARIAVALHNKGLLAPSGGSFSYETTRRILKEIEAQGLGKGPRSQSEALSARHAEEHARKAAILAEAGGKT